MDRVQQQILAQVRQLENRLASLAARDARPLSWVRAPGGGGEAIICLPPEAGIPAASGDTPGFATCTLYEFYDDAGTIKTQAVSPTATEVVYNTVETPIGVGGTKIVQAKKNQQGYYMVDVDNCETTPPGSS